MFFFLMSSELCAQLSYAEGGPLVEDPRFEVVPELRRYVDTISGNDDNDGKTPVTDWNTQ